MPTEVYDKIIDSIDWDSIPREKLVECLKQAVIDAYYDYDGVTSDYKHLLQSE